MRRGGVANSASLAPESGPLFGGVAHTEAWPAVLGRAGREIDRNMTHGQMGQKGAASGPAQMGWEGVRGGQGFQISKEGG
eukprot:1157711-Pelagomonas_calceolata.AAC.7